MPLDLSLLNVDTSGSRGGWRKTVIVQVPFPVGMLGKHCVVEAFVQSLVKPLLLSMRCARCKVYCAWH